MLSADLARLVLGSDGRQNGKPKKRYDQIDGRVAEWFKAPVLKTGRGLCSLVGSNPTPSASTIDFIGILRSFFKIP